MSYSNVSYLVLIFMKSDVKGSARQVYQRKLRKGSIMIIRVRANIEAVFHPQRLSYRLQLVSGGGDRYTEPYGQLSMWKLQVKKTELQWLKSLGRFSAFIPVNYFNTRRYDKKKYSFSGGVSNKSACGMWGVMNSGLVSIPADSLHMLLIRDIPTKHNH